MGGHTAWRKRVAAGELAKGSGGAALRHRPRLGRKGADIKLLNRLGNLGGHEGCSSEVEHHILQCEGPGFDSQHSYRGA